MCYTHKMRLKLNINTKYLLLDEKITPSIHKIPPPPGGGGEKINTTTRKYPHRGYFFSEKRAHRGYFFRRKNIVRP